MKKTDLTLVSDNDNRNSVPPERSPFRFFRSQNVGIGDAHDEKITLDAHAVHDAFQTPAQVPANPSRATQMLMKLRAGRRKLFDLMIRPARDYFYRRAADRLLGEMTQTAVRLNREDFHVFVEISGHVDNVTVRVFPGGWENDTAAQREIKILSGKLPGRGYYNKMKPRDLRNAIRLLIAMSDGIVVQE